MKNIPSSRVYSLITIVFLFGLQVLIASAQNDVPKGDIKCYVEENGRRREVPCPSSNSGNNTTTTTPNNSADEKAERERREREEKAEQQRIAEEERKRKEAAEKKQKEFEKTRDEGVKTLRDNSGNTTIRTGNSGDTGLRDSSPNTGLRESKPAVELKTTDTNKPATEPEPPRAYEKLVNQLFPNSSSDTNDRMRRAFQAIETKDWKVAKAWFETELNHDPNNIGIKRLAAFCDYSLTQSKSAMSDQITTPSPSTPTSEQERVFAEDFMRQLNDFLLNYVPKHPELKLSVTVQSSKSAPKKKEEPMLEMLRERLKKFLSIPKMREKTVVIAVRG